MPGEDDLLTQLAQRDGVPAVIEGVAIMGSITAYETNEGRRYRVRYRKPDRTQTDKRGFRTKRDAELFLASTEVAKARGEYVDATKARISVGALAADWLAHHGHLKASSARPLEIAWRLHVAPRWARIPVADVVFSEVQAWVTDLHLTRGKSPTTVIRAYGVLAAILDVAVRDRRVLTNAARGVKLPRKVGKEHTYLSHGQVELLASHSGPHKTLVEFLAYTGLRWGEMTALRVRNIDFSRHRINVQQNAVEVGGTFVVGTPKTHESRSVPFPHFLSEPLAELCTGKAPGDLVFGSGMVFIRPPDSRRGWWIAALKKCRVEQPSFPSITRHDLRHTAASLAISAGANVKAVQRMLGHSSAAMTLDTYVDLFDDDLDRVGRALDDARAQSATRQRGIVKDEKVPDR